MMNIWFGVFTPKGKLHAVQEGEYIAAEIAKAETEKTRKKFTVRKVVVEEYIIE
jgi:hypothetical protein